jgi:hypothetical protein
VGGNIIPRILKLGTTWRGVVTFILILALGREHEVPNYIKGWVSPRATMKSVGKRKIYHTYHESNPDFWFFTP